METKVCKTCGKDLPLGDYYYYFCKKRKKSYHRGSCKECERVRSRKFRRMNPILWKQIDRESKLKTKFGITTAQYNMMLVQQGGGCAICGGQNANGRRLAVDHSHTTGQIRGLLCHHCNAALGHLAEDVNRLRSVITYIEMHKRK